MRSSSSLQDHEQGDTQPPSDVSNQEQTPQDDQPAADEDGTNTISNNKDNTNNNNNTSNSNLNNITNDGVLENLSPTDEQLLLQQINDTL